MTAVATPVPPLNAVPRSPWHSPVPYLFGGLAAMLGLIAFALLILACSYWKLSGYLEDGERDLEAGSDGDGDSKADAKAAAQPVFEEKFLVIMAGQVKPTYLATPISSSSRASSFGSTSGRSSAGADKAEVEMEKINESGNDQVQLQQQEEVGNSVSSTTSTNNDDQVQVGSTVTNHVAAEQVP